MSMLAGPSWGGKRMKNILLWTGIGEIALAAVFLVIGLGTPLLRGGFTLTAAILGGVGVLLILWALRVGRKTEDVDRLRAFGIPGQADITGLRQTGVVLNDINPQIEMTLNVRLSDNRPPYTVTVKDFVPGMMIGRLSNGQPLPVRADPMNPQNVVVLWDQSLGAPGAMGGSPTVAGVQVGGTPNMSDPLEAMDQAGLQAMRGAGVVVPQMTSDQFDNVLTAQRDRIRASGIAGTMVVRGVKDMGQQINDRKLMQMEVEITLNDGRPPYRIDQPAAVPEHVADRIAKGFTAPVMVDQSDPKLTVIEWDQGMAG